jgi:crossover junction endodeoxyribonuclease RuvC
VIDSSLLTHYSSPAIRILGIDPGLRITGFGLIEKEGRNLAYITSGCVKTSETELAARLQIIFENLQQIIVAHEPAHVAVEKVFVSVNPSSTLSLGQARGAAICAAVTRGIPVFEYTALQVKQAVVGNGHARKEQVQEMVRRLLSLAAPVKPDSADALACAICHAHGGLGLGRLPRAGLRMRRGRLVSL